MDRNIKLITVHLKYDCISIHTLSKKEDKRKQGKKAEIAQILN